MKLALKLKTSKLSGKMTRIIDPVRDAPATQFNRLLPAFVRTDGVENSQLTPEQPKGRPRKQPPPKKTNQINEAQQQQNVELQNRFTRISLEDDEQAVPKSYEEVPQPELNRKAYLDLDINY